jgi:hypothetical protein
MLAKATRERGGSPSSCAARGEPYGPRPSQVAWRARRAVRPPCQRYTELAANRLKDFCGRGTMSTRDNRFIPAAHRSGFQARARANQKDSRRQPAHPGLRIRSARWWRPWWGWRGMHAGGGMHVGSYRSLTGARLSHPSVFLPKAVDFGFGNFLLVGFIRDFWHVGSDLSAQ